MPDRASRSLLLLASLGFSAWAVALLSAQEVPVAPEETPDAHEQEAGRVLLSELPAGLRQRVRGLWSEVVCSCPNENWSKTLANCPDGCADPQKREILEAVEAGKSDEGILAEQRALYGPRALASPGVSGSGIGAYVLPFVVLAGGIGFLGIVLGRWQRATRLRREQASRPAGARPAEGEILAVERELQEID